MLKEARLACGRYKIDLEENKKNQAEQVKRQALKRKLEAEERSIMSEIKRIQANSTADVEPKEARLREIRSQLTKS